MLNINEGTEKKETHDNLNADVLVIGSGAAGLRAAVSAIETDINLNVIVLNKGGKNNCTSYADNSFEMSGGGGCGLSAVLDDKDSVDKYYEDLSKIAMV